MQISYGRKTPFYEEHVKAGGRLMSISGWIRPIHYGSPAKEISAVRNALGVFDLHPMSRHVIKGPDALAFMQLLVTSDVKRAVSSSVAQYTCFCDEQGGIIDDVLIFPKSAIEFLITSSATAAKTLGGWMRQWVKESGLNVQIRDVSTCQTQLALQGPRSLEVVRRVFGVKTTALNHMQFVQTALNGTPVLLARIGYTGECGFEIFTDTHLAINLWQRLIESGAEFDITPFGIVAAQTLRIEKGYVLNGVDMSRQNNPYEMGFDWMICTDKGNFLGKDGLLRAKAIGVKQRVRRFYLEGTGPVPSGTKIYAEEREVGRVTSCCNSPTVGLVIGMGLVDTSISGDYPCYVRRDIEKWQLSFVEKAFYDPEGLRLKAMQPEGNSLS